MKENQERSLEDKAKEWFREVSKATKEEYDSYWIPDKAFPTHAYESGYKQALKDMIDRAEELQLPYIRMYKKIAEELSK